MNSPIKWAAITVGGVVAVAHIGVLGHLIRKQPKEVVPVPTINIPSGTPYSSYKIEAGKDGYTIEYKGNDPKVMTTAKDIRKSNGLFGIGGKSEVTTYEQYTMDHARNTGGGAGGKLSAKREECIKAAGGGESTGRIVGASISSSAASFVTGIPYIGWVAAGWLAMFGQDKGGEIGAEMATIMEDCDEFSIETSK